MKELFQRKQSDFESLHQIYHLKKLEGQSKALLVLFSKSSKEKKSEGFFISLWHWICTTDYHNYRNIYFLYHS